MTTDCAAAVIVAAPPAAQEAFDPLWTLVGGKPLLAWSVRAFERAPAIGEIALVVVRSRIETARALALAEGWPRTMPIVAGGQGWNGAVESGLRALATNCRWAVIHDAARPLVTPEIIAAGLTVAEPTGAACASEPVKETLKRVEAGLVAETLERSRLALLQTPRVFERAALLARYEHAASGGDDAPDDVALALAAGMRVVAYPGGHENLRVVSSDDLALVAEALARRGLAPPAPTA